MDLVKKNNPTYQEEKLEEIRYGLESIYLTYTKIFLIFVLAYFLGIIKETLLLLVTYNIIGLLLLEYTLQKVYIV